MRDDRQARRPVHCPLCMKGRVIDVAAGVDMSKLMLYGPLQSHKAQLFSKCPKCGQQIGITLISS